MTRGRRSTCPDHLLRGRLDCAADPVRHARREREIEVAALPACRRLLRERARRERLRAGAAAVPATATARAAAATAGRGRTARGAARVPSAAERRRQLDRLLLDRVVR